MKKRIFGLVVALAFSISAFADSPLPPATKLPAKTAFFVRVDMRDLEKAPGGEDLSGPFFERFRDQFKLSARKHLGPKLIANVNHALLFSEIPEFNLSRSFSTNVPTAVYLSGEFGEQRVLWELENLEGYRASDIDGTKVVSASELGEIVFAFPREDVILVANGAKAMASALRAFKGKEPALSSDSIIATLSASEAAPLLGILDTKGHAARMLKLAGGVSLGSPVAAWFTVSPVTKGANVVTTHSRLSLSFQFASAQEAEVAWRTLNGLRMILALNPETSPELMAAVGKASVGAKGKVAYATFDLDSKIAKAIAELLEGK